MIYYYIFLTKFFITAFGGFLIIGQNPANAIDYLSQRELILLNSMNY